MAEADAKLNGVPAVAAGTRGVGAANLAIGVHTAHQDCTPMIVIVGQVETTNLGREAFQEVDLPAFFGPITKWGATVTSGQQLPGLLALGIVRATTGRPGPVMLALPVDVLQQDVPLEEVEHAVKVVTAERSTPVPAAADIDRLLVALTQASRPVVIVGGGARGAWSELVDLAERFGLGVYSAFRRQDAFPNSHPQYLGHLGLGSQGNALRALREADLVLVLGSRLDEVTTQSYQLPQRGAQVVHVDVDPLVSADGVHAAWALQADVPTLVRMVLDRGDQRCVRDWSEFRADYIEASTPALRDPGQGVDPAAVIDSMNRLLPDNAIVANDAGNFSAFLHRYRRYNEPSTQLAPTSGAMGYGIPAAVAAALTARHRTVVSVCGDGGFLMTGHELETAVRYGLDLLVIVMRNGLYGTIAMHQAREFGRVSGVDIGPVDLAAFARSLGAHGLTVDHPNDLDGKIKEAVGMSGVRVVDICTDPDLISPEGRLSSLIAPAEHRQNPPGQDDLGERGHEHKGRRDQM
jgi:acetolactate synthase-1/2/3 large subunit